MTASLFRTTDVDEASAFVNRVYYENRIEPARDASLPFRFKMAHSSVGPMTFGILKFGCETLAEAGGLDMTYSVAVPLKGAFAFQFERDEFTANPFTAAVATPRTHLSYRGYSTGTEGLFVVAISREHLHNELRNLLGRDRIGTINLAPSMNLRTGPGALWWRLASSLALSLTSPSGLMTNPMMTASLSSAVMTGMLLATDHPYRDDLDAWTRSVPPATIRRATEIIESRAHEPLTIPEIAAEIGCRVTALQTGYRKHLNMTPREHLGRVRMDRAHTMLKTAHPDSTSVAEIAAACGFHHPGRFAAQYRQAYRVLPSTTLREG